MRTTGVAVLAAIWACVLRAGVELPPEPANVPELLVTERGERVTDVGLWERVRKPEILKWFRENVYGERPVGRPADLSFAEVRPAEPCYGGKAVSKLVRATYSGPGGTGSMTFRVWIPKADRPVPVFVHSSPRPAETAADPEGPRPVYLLPAELIVSRGFACIAYCNRDVAIDAHVPSADITTTGVFRVFGPAKMENRRPTEWGVLSAWAWGASRVMDWIETEPLLDASHVAIVGLSRNGKAALVAGVTDERFALTVSCCSGCSGAKLNHVYTQGSEMVEGIMRNFPYWFCPNYGQWIGRERKSMPYDQHEWIALIAPRLLYVSSATEDVTAGPRGEFASALFASPVWGLYGVGGLGGRTFPAADAPLQSGNVGYHVRTGHHGITDFDWERYMDFAEGKGWGLRKP